MNNTESITVIDNVYLYRLMYEALFLLPLLIFVLFLAFPDFINLIFGLEGDKRINLLMLLVLGIIWLLDIYKRYKNFYKNPPRFIFEKSSIIFDNFKEDADYRKQVKKNINDIAQASYIVIAENTDRHGFIEHKSILKKIFKTDLGDLFIETFIHGFNIVYWLLIGLPSRVFRFLVEREPLNLIWKNLLIEFKDGEAFIININSFDELQKIQNILGTYDKEISKIPWLTVIMHEDQKFSVSSY